MLPKEPECDWVLFEKKVFPLRKSQLKVGINKVPFFSIFSFKISIKLSGLKFISSFWISLKVLRDPTKL